MAQITTIYKLENSIIACNKCPRLVRWRKTVAKKKTSRYHNENYWGKPVPGWGDNNAELIIVGLAPAAHGANRTGRMFTGDRSGEFLYKALYDFNFCNQPESSDKTDGLKLSNCWITAAVRCAPPQNKPSTDELKNCRAYLSKEILLLNKARVILALGKVAFESVIKMVKELNFLDKVSKYKFTHGAEVIFNNGIKIISSFHPSQQNTFTGKLTKPMFNKIFKRINNLIG